MKAPFDRHGNLQHFPERWYEYPAGEAPLPRGPDWREAAPFEGTLIFAGFRRGQSAAYFLWRTGETRCRTFPMFMVDMADLVEFGVIEYGEVRDAAWEICKRGTNYGIRRVAAE